MCSGTVICWALSPAAIDSTKPRRPARSAHGTDSKWTLGLKSGKDSRIAFILAVIRVVFRLRSASCWIVPVRVDFRRGAQSPTSDGSDFRHGKSRARLEDLVRFDRPRAAIF